MLDSPMIPCRPNCELIVTTDPSPSHEVWGSDELTQLILQFLNPFDLHKSAQVCQSWNRVAVQCILDRDKLWKPQRISHLRISDSPSAIDALSALLISVHIKKLGYVFFEFVRTVTVKMVFSSFERMRRLVERMSSLRIVRVHWPSSLKDTDITDNSLISLCRSMEGFLNTTVTRGCSKLMMTGFNDLLAKKYQLKKPGKKGSGKLSSKPSALTKARAFLAPSSNKRAKEEPLATVPLLSDEDNYSRRANPSRFGSSPWVSIVLAPELKEASKIAKFETNSTNLFRPPFSQWIFALFKASPITELCAHFVDLPDDPVEQSLILDRLTDAIPNLTVLYIDSARSGVMGDLMRWASRFKELKTLGVQAHCFPSQDDKDLDLGDIDFPNLSRFESPPFFIPQFLKSESTPNSAASSNATDKPRRFKSLSSGVIAATYRWTNVEVKDAAEALSLAKTAVIMAMGSSARDCTVQIAFRFQHDFFKVAEALNRPGVTWPDLTVKNPSVNPDDDVGPKVILEVVLPGTREEVRQGIFDDKIKGFLKLLPDLDGLVLSSNEAHLNLELEELSDDQVEKFRKVCPNLCSTGMT